MGCNIHDDSRLTVLETYRTQIGYSLSEFRINIDILLEGFDHCIITTCVCMVFLGVGGWGIYTIIVDTWHGSPQNIEAKTQASTCFVPVGALDPLSCDHR